MLEYYAGSSDLAAAAAAAAAEASALHHNWHRMPEPRTRKRRRECLPFVSLLFLLISTRIDGRHYPVLATVSPSPLPMAFVTTTTLPRTAAAATAAAGTLPVKTRVALPLLSPFLMEPTAAAASSVAVPFLPKTSYSPFPAKSSASSSSSSISSTSTTTACRYSESSSFFSDEPEDNDQPQFKEEEQEDTLHKTTTSSVLKGVVPLSKSLRHCLQVDNNNCNTRTTAAVPWIVGHRGCLYQELENTREGFQKCARMGCDAVELDVFVLKCGTVVVFHGNDSGSDEKHTPGLLDQYCVNINNHGNGDAATGESILDYTYEQVLEQLRFNPNHPEFPCPADTIRQGEIPTLEQVLMDAKKSGLYVKIELKGKGTVTPTVELVERLDMVQQCSYSSFDLEQLKELRALRPDRVLYPTGALFNEIPNSSDYYLLERAKECGATEIHLKYDTCTKERVDCIHAAGFGTMLWMRGPIGMNLDCAEKYWDVGNEDESMYSVLIDTGVQQMCVNKPDILINMRFKRRILADDDEQQTDGNSFFLSNSPDEDLVVDELLLDDDNDDDDGLTSRR